MENKSGYSETVSEVGGPRIEHVRYEAVGSVVSDKVFDLGLKEGYAVVEFASGVEVRGGEEVFKGFGEANLLGRERDSVKRDIFVFLECGFVEEVGIGWGGDDGDIVAA